MLKILKALLPALMTLFPHGVFALTIVADLGGESTASLFAAVAPVPEMSAPDAPAASPAQPVALNDAVFPVVSSRLHPGAVTPRSLSLPEMMPLFLIGDDTLSRRWLSQQREHLTSLNATGLVVSVASSARFEALQQQADGLTLLPVSGDDLAQRLQLDAYPVLITDAGLSQ
ncbi:integrating conjugative element protein [Citrobacter sp. S2-9]|uniref:Integrating conjugative element protein n=1 Tax=Citrobacter enshiensis TaxID=2971264 RepID=A0ABT8PVL0_9ENTR|nr:integrating conjugative element protein [Citrobacter enshiensis]MDN8600298.1 integrating conjugative element protein [Citrobacter enshiensis]